MEYYDTLDSSLLIGPDDLDLSWKELIAKAVALRVTVAPEMLISTMLDLSFAIEEARRKKIDCTDDHIFSIYIPALNTAGYRLKANLDERVEIISALSSAGWGVLNDDDIFPEIILTAEAMVPSQV